MTIAEALNVQQRTVSARDAEVLLGAVLRLNRASLRANDNRSLTTAEERSFLNFVKRREANEPVAYITGVKEFYGREFVCDKRALIPRPETEGVVERTVARAREMFQKHSDPPCPVRILELGTGCGAIAVSLALELGVPATIIATDISGPARELALLNWEALSDGQPTGNLVVKFVQADLFDHESITKRPFDIIVANLPYVETTWQVETGAQPDVVFFEPDVALFGGTDGLDIYRRFFAEVPKHLEKDGTVIIEYGESQTPAILPLVTAAFPDKKVTVHKDYARLDRVLEIG